MCIDVMRVYDSYGLPSAIIALAELQSIFLGNVNKAIPGLHLEIGPRGGGAKGILVKERGKVTYPCV